MGQIAASDVARLIINLERALARAAYVALRRERPADTGRHRAAIEKATRLTFAGIARGSVVELLALPDAQELAGETRETGDALPITVQALGEAAFDQLLRALVADAEDVDARLAGAVADLADELGVGGRNDWVRLVEDGSNDEPVSIDHAVRVRMRTISNRRRALDTDQDTVAGRLVEADFERRTARVQPARGQSVTVSFTDDLDDDIHQALREVASFEGLVTFDPKTSAARQVDLRRVLRSEQLMVTTGDHGAFTEHRSIAQLQREQGVRAVEVAGDLRADGLTDEDREALASLLAE